MFAPGQIVQSQTTRHIRSVLHTVSRKPQYKDVYRRTIEIRVHYEPLNSN